MARTVGARSLPVFFSLQRGAEVLTLKWDQLDKAAKDGTLPVAGNLERGTRGKRSKRAEPALQPIVTAKALDAYRRLRIRRLAKESAPFYRRIRRRLERVRVPGV